MTSFSEDYFYIRTGGSTSLVLDVERSTNIFGFSGFVKVGSKTIVTAQKSDNDNDAAYQLWRYENGYLVNKQANLYLEVENGKVKFLMTYHVCDIFMSKYSIILDFL